MASKAATAAETAENREDAAEAPLLDTIAVAIKKMVARGKERGYLTYDELNATLPPDQVTSEQIEDTMTMLSELGIAIIESANPSARKIARVRRHSQDRAMLAEAGTFAGVVDRLLRTADQALAETREGRKETVALLDRLEARLASHG